MIKKERPERMNFPEIREIYRKGGEKR